MTAIGIHDHPTLPLGLRPPKNAPALELGAILTGHVPAHPVMADHFGKLKFGLYGNDKYGDCGPTSVCNHARMVSGALLGREIQPSQADAFDLYRRSGNPGFNPALPPGDPSQDDNGVDMQTMLEALVAGGVGDGQGGILTPIGFAKVNVLSDAELTAAASIFGTLWGVVLQTSQQTQSQGPAPVWDYVRSSLWGGHAILNGAYEVADGASIEDVISWDKRIQTTAQFRRHQLQQAWVVIWPWLLEHPAFQAGVDLPALQAAYTALTGRPLPVPA